MPGGGQKKADLELLYDPAIPIPCMFPKGLKAGTQQVLPTVFTGAKRSKKPKVHWWVDGQTKHGVCVCVYMRVYMHVGGIYIDMYAYMMVNISCPLGWPQSTQQLGV